MIENRIPILLDTDPGSDIDDALALAYLLRQPRCELLGVTTVTGDTRKRAGICDVLCREFGRTDVPIVAGAERPLPFGPGQPNVPQYLAIADRPHRTDFPPDSAVDFLRQTIRARPGEVTLLSIGPLTNIGLLFALDPEIPSLLGGFVSMLGSYFAEGRQEWNVICDPTAAAMVLPHSRDHQLVGLDVTMQCTMPPDQVRTRFEAAPLNIVLPMAEKWFESAHHVTFHDPLAAAMIFEPGLCRFLSGEVTLPSPKEDAERPALTRFAERPSGPHEVAAEVDAEAFFTHYFGVLQN